MNINSYIALYGKYSFKEMEFNDIDALILAEVSMLSLEHYLKDGQISIKIKDIPSDKIPDEIVFDSPDRRNNKIQLKNMIKSKRYKNLVVSDIVREFSLEKVNQFYACTIFFPNGDFYISYRGTDISLIGWKEDFLLATQETYLAQEQGLEYMRKIISKYKGNFYIGGHSKGGNIAVYSACHLDRAGSDRLINVFSFDGPGMRKPFSSFSGYELIKLKIIKYRTYNNVIGALYNQSNNYRVIRSTALLFGGHDLYGWQINPITGDFYRYKDVSKTSRVLTERFQEWVESLTIQERELASDALFDILKSCKYVYDLPTKGLRDLRNYKKNLADYTSEEQEKLKYMFKQLFKYLFMFNKVKKPANQPKSLQK